MGLIIPRERLHRPATNVQFFLTDHTLDPAGAEIDESLVHNHNWAVHDWEAIDSAARRT